jgi:hypothetical protein
LLAQHAQHFLDAVEHPICRSFIVVGDEAPNLE